MLIIAILMFVLKKTKLRFAYALLTVTALAAIARDASLRTTLPLPKSQAQNSITQDSSVPFAITRLADSPFSEARPSRADAILDTQTRDESTPVPTRRKTAVRSGVYFLTVAIQVDSGAGPVAFNRGTRVLLVKEQDGKLLVRHHRTDFLIEKSQATDDLNALTALARNSS